MSRLTIVVIALLLFSSAPAAYANLLLEKPERTIFQEQVLPVMVYTEPVEGGGDTTDVDIELTVSNADLTSIKKITLAPKVERREDSDVRYIPATDSAPSKRIITEKLTYAGEIKANKLMLSVYLEALQYGEFTVTGGGGTGTYKILPIEVTGTESSGVVTPVSEPPIAPSPLSPPSVSGLDVPGEVSPPDVSDVVEEMPLPETSADDYAPRGASDSLEEGGHVDTIATGEIENVCEDTDTTNYMWWFLAWIFSLIFMVLVGYFVGKRECADI